MTSSVHAWKQAGKVFVWRYPPHQKKHKGWHFTCQDAACDNLTQLIEAMRTEAQPSRRSITLSRATSDIWCVPNFGEPVRETFHSLVLEYEPDFPDLVIAELEGRLRLKIGDTEASTMIEALRDLKAGGGDYCLVPKDKDSLPIWIWWMVSSAA